MYRHVIKFLLTLILCMISFSSFAKDIEQMSLREKVGQMFISAAYPNQTTASKEGCNDPHEVYENVLVSEYHVGGVLLKYRWWSEDQIARIKELQGLSETPLFICQDIEQGLGSRIYDAITYPCNRALGAIQDTSLLYELGCEISRQSRCVGVNFPLAPVVDVNSNPKNPIIHLRAYGDDPYQVAECASQYVLGLQSSGLIASAKHFPGHGDTDQDSHFNLPVVYKGMEELNACEWIPFRKVIQEGVRAVMTSHLLLPQFDDALPCSLSKKIIEGILRENLGFNGLVITDDLMMKGSVIEGNVYKLAVLAGNDLIIASKNIPEAINSIVDAVNRGEIPESRINASVRRILRAKTTLPEMTTHLPHKTEEAKNLCHRLFEESITLIKGDAIPEINQFSLHQIGDGELSSSFISKNIPDAGWSLIAVFPPSRRSCGGEGIAVVLPTQEEKNFLYNKINALTHQLREKQKNILIVWFGTPYALVDFDADVILCAFEVSKEAQQAVFRKLKLDSEAD